MAGVGLAAHEVRQAAGRRRHRRPWPDTLHGGAYTPGQSVRFRFTAPRGFDGWHGFEVLDATPAHCVLEHRIEMRTRGAALLYWLLVIRPLHDVCIEDVLSQTQVSLGIEPRPVARTAGVRLLRWLASGGGRRAAPPFAGNRHPG